MDAAIHHHNRFSRRLRPTTKEYRRYAPTWRQWSCPAKRLQCYALHCRGHCVSSWRLDTNIWPFAKQFQTRHTMKIVTIIDTTLDSSNENSRYYLWWFQFFYFKSDIQTIKFDTINKLQRNQHWKSARIDPPHHPAHRRDSQRPCLYRFARSNFQVVDFAFSP